MTEKLSRRHEALWWVVLSLQEGGPPLPEWARDEFLAAWDAFEWFHVKSLGEAFEVPDHKHLDARRQELQSAVIARHVARWQAKGFPLTDSNTAPDKSGEGAFTKVGAALGISAKQVEKLRRRWRENCKATGTDPDDFTPRGHADAQAGIAAALARALSPKK